MQAPALTARPAPAVPAAVAARPHPSIWSPGATEQAAVALDNDYYAAAQGKQGAQLLRSLHEIVRNGHIDTGYAQARDAMFGLVDDVASNDKVVDIYTGRVESGVSDRKTAFSNNLNAEHTWPQSLGATGVAQSDLHQLMPSDIQVNGRRGNLPYGEVVKQEWSTGKGGPNDSRLGVDALGTTVFEPRAAVRGDIARGLLYFFVRYNMSRPGRYTLQNFRHELPTLLKWDKADPVDDIERQRNDAIFAVQKNRNPFVDHPEWVQSVDFPALRLDESRGVARPGLKVASKPAA